MVIFLSRLKHGTQGKKRWAGLITMEVMFEYSPGKVFVLNYFFVNVTFDCVCEEHISFFCDGIC